MTISPQDGWAHVGCPTCGNVTTVPLDRMEPTPWCIHNGSTVVWRDPHPETQAGPTAWTRTTRVTVTIDWTAKAKRIREAYEADNAS